MSLLIGKISIYHCQSATNIFANNMASCDLYIKKIMIGFY